MDSFTGRNQNKSYRIWRHFSFYRPRIFVPSATARAGAVVPILLGMVAAFGLPRDSRLAALLVITSVQAVSIWNIGIKTAAAQNMVALNFIQEQFNVDISWGAWLLYAAPSRLLCLLSYFSL